MWPIRKNYPQFSARKGWRFEPRDDRFCNSVTRVLIYADCLTSRQFNLTDFLSAFYVCDTYRFVAIPCAWRSKSRKMPFLADKNRFPFAYTFHFFYKVCVFWFEETRASDRFPEAALLFVVLASLPAITYRRASVRNFVILCINL